MHYVTLDTNTWIYLANGTEPVKILSFIKKQVDWGNITILLPEIVVKEWNKNKGNKVELIGLQHFKDVVSAFDKIEKLLGDGETDFFSFLIEESKNKDDTLKTVIAKFKEKKADIETAVKSNIKLIDDLFKCKGVVVIPSTNVEILKAAEFAIERKAPLKEKNGFADALIFFTFVNYVKRNQITGAFFITYNIHDFCESKTNRQLHSDLIPYFTTSNSKFFTIVGQAMNTIEKVLTQEQIDFIITQQDLSGRYRDIFCRVCEEDNGWKNQVYFDNPQPLIDKRIDKNFTDPDQIEFEFADDFQKTPNINHHDYIEVGYCNWCNTQHFICVDCSAINAVWDYEYDERKECDKCYSIYYITRQDNEEDST